MRVPMLRTGVDSWGVAGAVGKPPDERRRQVAAVQGAAGSSLFPDAFRPSAGIKTVVSARRRQILVALRVPPAVPRVPRGTQGVSPLLASRAHSDLMI